eukprot:m.180996 g.180996  ORF g.180996 m.180996 type:complete len:76 (+) comp39260_c0_seq54:742-969(+)
MRAGRVADAPWSVCPWLFHFVSDKGHLARVLAYGVGMNVKAIEAESAHLDGAERCDKFFLQKAVQRLGKAGGEIG